MGDKGRFLSHRLHSLLGLIPLGAFLLLHLMLQYQAVQGEDAFNRGAEFMASLPFVLFLEIVVIYLPILFHAGYGIYLAFQAKHNVIRHSRFRNHMFFWQRITGLITLVFVGWHVWETRIQKALGNAEVNYDMMADILNSPYMAAFYAVGVLAVAFHFANGIWSFLVHWGITVGPRSQRAATYLTMGIFAALAYVGLRALAAFL